MRIGAHMSISGGKYKALEHGKELGCEAIQVFIRNVRGWVSKPLVQEGINKFLKKREELKNVIWPVFSHNSYLINLASTDNEKLEKSYIAMLDELKKCDQLQLEYTNIHPGVIPKSEVDKITKEEALEKIAEQINMLISDTKDSNVKILLETTAGQGTGLGHKFEDFRYIIDKIKNKSRIGVCFDTCHSFVAGYDFSTEMKYEELWEHFDDVIGLDYLLAFHLNDSTGELGSKKDRHAHIGQGKIGKAPFGFLLNDKRFKDHPGILETPKEKDMDKINLNTLRSLRK